MRRHLSFANVASALALFVALGGASAYATRLVGASRLKDDAVRSRHIRDGQVRGADVDEASLGRVPSAAAAQTLDGKHATDFLPVNGTAVNANKLQGKAATAFAPAGDVHSTGVVTIPAPATPSKGPDVSLITNGTISLIGNCWNNGSGIREADVTLKSSEAGARFAAGFPTGSTDSQPMTDLPDSGDVVAFVSDNNPAGRWVPFTITTPSGNALTGSATVQVNLSGDDCFVSASGIG